MSLNGATIFPLQIRDGIGVIQSESESLACLKYFPFPDVQNASVACREQDVLRQESNASDYALRPRKNF